MNTLKVTLPSALDAGVDFPKLNELRVNFSTVTPTTVTRINLSINTATTLYISGSGYFTNAGGTSNLGNTIPLTSGDIVAYFITVGECYLSIANKFAITRLGTSAGGYLISASSSAFTTTSAVVPKFNVGDLKFINTLVSAVAYNTFYGNINTLPKSSTVTTFLMSTGTTGVVNKVFGALSPTTFNYASLLQLNLANNTDVAGSLDGLNFPVISLLNLSGTSVKGTLGTINNSVTSLDFGNTDVRVNLADLSLKTGLTRLGLSGSLSTGDVSALANIPISIMSGLSGLNISGDVSRINNSTIYISNFDSTTLRNRNSNLSTTHWTNKRSDRTHILACAGVRLVNSVDQFLIDMATLTLSPSATEPYLKTIDVIGNRTSASDAAVANLISKGLTVTVTAPTV